MVLCRYFVYIEGQAIVYQIFKSRGNKGLELICTPHLYSAICMLVR